MNNTKRGIALGLAGGAAKGLAHVGVLRALEERKLAPTCIAGTSAGAIIGGLYAAGKSVDELTTFLAEIDQGEFRKLIDLNWGRGSLVAGDRIEDMLRGLVGKIRIEELPIPFLATAVDIHTGAGFFFDRGDLVDAIRASISIPGIFEPVSANGGHLVDGGLRKNLALNVLNRFEPRMLIGANIVHGRQSSDAWETTEIQRAPAGRRAENRELWERIKSKFPWTTEEPVDDATAAAKELAGRVALPGLTELLTKAFAVMSSESNREEIKLARPDLLIELDMREIEVWEFWRGPEAAEIGYRQTIAALDRYRSGRNIFALSVRKIRRRRAVRREEGSRTTHKRRTGPRRRK
ncbi:MAG TPA: patatin-like phospholipase family protein [Spirochaetia bacterium]|nr:patatin-like phospholipase family protein [Spirochaetia bacterium]